MKKEVTFKVELKVKVEYNVPEGIATYPYTSFGAFLDKDGIVNVFTGDGKIIKGDVVKVENNEN